MLEPASSLLLLVLCAGILLRGTFCGKGYDAFLKGAQLGLDTGIHLIPALTAMTLMVNLARTGGLSDLLVSLLSPIAQILGFPAETLPIMLLRPLSGSGALSALQGLMASCGPDSRAARIAAVVTGSSETILYTMTVYLSAAGIQKLKYAFPLSMISWGVGCVCAVLFIGE